MNMRINIEPRRCAVVSEIVARAGAVFRGHYIRADTEGVIDATDEKWKGAAAMRERDTQAVEALEHASKNHRTDCERGLCWHPNQPRQPVFRHSIPAQHVPGMHENRGIDFFGGAPNRLKRCVVQV